MGKARLLCTINVIALLISPRLVRAQATPSISLTIGTANAAVQLGKPVIIKVVTTSVSDHDVTYWRENSSDQGGYVYKIIVHNDAGVAPADTELGKRFKELDNPGHNSSDVPPEAPVNRSGGWFKLKPGESTTDYVDVSRLVYFNKAGTYTIRLQRFDEDRKLNVQSNAINVTVGE